MAKPKITVPNDLLKSLATAKPVELEPASRATLPASNAPAPKIYPSSRPVRGSAAPRSTNRGK